MLTLQQLFVWSCLARVNPVLPPRRKAATAVRWAVAIRHVSVFLVGKNFVELQRWAAAVLLGSGSGIELPLGYVPLGDGSLRRGARDAGGIEGQCLLTMAAVVISPIEVTDRQWKCWSILYPRTAQLAGLTSAADLTIAEWELVGGHSRWLLCETLEDESGSHVICETLEDESLEDFVARTGRILSDERAAESEATAKEIWPWARA